MLEVLYTKRSVCQTICVIYSRPVGQTTEGVIHEEAVMSATHTQTRPLTFDERKEKKEIKKRDSGGEQRRMHAYLENSAISSWWIFCLSMSSEGRYLDIRFSINTVLQYCLWTRYWREIQDTILITCLELQKHSD